MEKTELEEGLTFAPRFNKDGLIPCIATSAHSGKVLMLAYMNAESLKLSIQTGEAHYWSRSRQEIWHKGATSGNVQKIISMKADCDQDAIWIVVDMPQYDGKDKSCHTGREGCFYRDVTLFSDGEELSFNE